MSIKHAELWGLELTFKKLVELRSCFTNLINESNQKQTTWNRPHTVDERNPAHTVDL